MPIHVLWMGIFATLFGLSALVNLCQTAFAGLAEPVVEVDAGFFHGAAYHIIADISGAGEEIA